LILSASIVPSEAAPRVDRRRGGAARRARVRRRTGSQWPPEGGHRFPFGQRRRSRSRWESMSQQRIQALLSGL